MGKRKNIITKSEAARVLGVSPTTMDKKQNRKVRPAYFVKSCGKLQVNTNAESWRLEVEKFNLKRKGLKPDAKKDKTQKVKTEQDKSWDGYVSKDRKFKGKLRAAVFQRDGSKCQMCGRGPDEAILCVDHIKSWQDGGLTTYENGQVLCEECNKGKDTKKKDDKTKGLSISKLAKAAAIAEFQDIIFAAKIKEEKAKQEEIKTAEKIKELGPMSLLKHFFSFSENLIQRIYRRPHELSPQLEALYLGGEPKKAVELMKRELEAIVKNTQAELLKAIEEEGYKYKHGK